MLHIRCLILSNVLRCESPKHENPKTLNSLVVLQLWGESPSLKLSTPYTQLLEDSKKANATVLKY